LIFLAFFREISSHFVQSGDLKMQVHLFSFYGKFGSFSEFHIYMVGNKSWKKQS